MNIWECDTHYLLKIILKSIYFYGYIDTTKQFEQRSKCVKWSSVGDPTFSQIILDNP